MKQRKLKKKSLNQKKDFSEVFLEDLEKIKKKLIKVKKN
jgi:hypothetical protein